MLAANSPCYYESEDYNDETQAVDDLDAVNLYPSAMVEIADRYGGLPCGDPEFRSFKERTTYALPEEILRSRYFLASVRIWKLGKPLLFPIVNGPSNAFQYKKSFYGVEEDEEESSVMDVQNRLFQANQSRMFTNHPEGANLVIDKITMEDIYEFHGGAEIEYLQVLYWPQSRGGNSTIGRVIRYLYSTRLELAKRGCTAAANARKLTMNSAYGRLLMKPPTSFLKFVEGEESIAHYVARHSNSVQSAELIRPNFASVERRKGIESFYNATHIGAFILSVSKRIMSRVMNLAETLFFRPHLPLPMFYMDTDSIHILRKLVNPLFQEYKNRYGEKLLVRPGAEQETELALSLIHI